MPSKWLFAIAVFSLFPLNSYSQSYEASEYSGDSNSYYSSSRTADDGEVYSTRADPNENAYSSKQMSDDGVDYSYRHASNEYSSQRRYTDDEGYSPRHNFRSYSSRLPSSISAPGEKLIIVDPHVHAWGAYTSNGKLIRAGIAAAGSNWCRDLGRPCRTKIGSFRIFSLGNSECYSTKFPLPDGGAPMPYCMYFNGNQAIHGSDELAEANISHGCVRIRVSDAEWIRFNFAAKGTKVIVRPY